MRVEFLLRFPERIAGGSCIYRDRETAPGLDDRHMRSMATTELAPWAASECRPEPQPISRQVFPDTSRNSFRTPSTAKSMRSWSIFLE